MLNADDPLVMRMPVPAGVTKVRMSHIVLFFYQMNYHSFLLKLQQDVNDI